MNDRSPRGSGGGNRISLALVALASALGWLHAADAGSGWVVPAGETNRPTWGRRGALLWGLPAGRAPVDGPRGLIRLHYPILTNGGYDLVNFIAIEPVVAGRRGFMC